MSTPKPIGAMVVPTGDPDAPTLRAVLVYQRKGGLAITQQVSGATGVPLRGFTVTHIRSGHALDGTLATFDDFRGAQRLMRSALAVGGWGRGFDAVCRDPRVRARMRRILDNEAKRRGVA